jgi:putative ABC transport system permease protein
MGSVVLICRLVVKDLRRHPVEAAIFLIAITAATATLALGLALDGATSNLYRQTRAATAGPDVVAIADVSGQAALTALTPLGQAPGVVGHNGPYPLVDTMLKANGSTVRALVEGGDTKSGPIDRPRVTSGQWLRPGGMVVDRGFAAALGVRVGDRITVADRTFPVVGIAVTAARMVYPWAAMSQGGGLDDYSGLVWLTERDTRALSSPQRPVSYAMGLKLADPAATQAFVDSFRTSTIPASFFTWQFIAVQDSVLLNDTQPVLVIGSWLLSFLALAGVATLVAGRAAEQTRRVGLLKAVGATPAQVATVVFAEYLALALLADGLGLLAAWLTAPALTNPSAGLINTTTPPSGSTITGVTFLALAVAAFTTLGPAIRAARTGTVNALADAAHPPRRRPAGLTALSAWVPTPLLLGLRLTARRPWRALLHAGGIVATVTAITALLTLYAQPQQGYYLGASTLTNLRADQGQKVLLGVTAVLTALAAINIIVITWTTALEARRPLAIARTLGATPGQVTAGLSLAQLLPALPATLTGIPLGIGLYSVFSVGTMTRPPDWWLLAIALGTPLAVAAFAAAPARSAARRPIAHTLSSETG